MEFMYDNNSDYAVGVDIGGTKINAGIIDKQGRIIYTHNAATMAGQAHVMDRVMLAVESLAQGAALQHIPLAVTGLGVGTAGQVDWNTGSIRFASDLLPGYTGTPVKQMLHQRFGLPVYVDNDVNVLALTEKRLGAGRGVNHMVILALGTGVGGAVIADGRLLHGAWGGAGELGHMSVNYAGLPCVCGGIGCLEQYASGTGIARRMRLKRRQLGDDSEPIDAREVVSLWLAGDRAAGEVMDETFAALGAALASLAHMFNPEVIVIGGGLADAGEPFFGRIREEALRRGMKSFLDGVRIEPAYQGSWGGMIGAGLQVWEYRTR